MNKFLYDKSEKTFTYLLKTLKDTIKGWNYFVNWTKVIKNVEDIEVSLNILNYLIGKNDINSEFRKLLKKYPEVIKVLPLLIACREQSFKILKLSSKDTVEFEDEEYSFFVSTVLTDEQIDKIAEFAENTGLFNLFRDTKVKNLVDYVLGVEVGLDSNGRKNRSGTLMETLVETFIDKICTNHGYEYISQATSAHIKEKWDIEVKVDKTDRRFDFAVNTWRQLFLIETNYYSGGGSKLKATAGEYKILQDLISYNGYELIWITDGKGWLTASRPLQETFNHNKYLLNLNMLQNGVLEDILTEKLKI